MALLVAVVLADYAVAWAANEGFPLVYTRASESSRLVPYRIGFVMRGVVYGVLAFLAASASRAAGLLASPWRIATYTAAAAFASALFWFVMDPTAFPGVFPELSSTLARVAPLFERIYEGRGSVEYFWWLCVVHWMICFGLVIVVFDWPIAGSEASQARTPRATPAAPSQGRSY
jgi:hypothetical protein